jgi:hypothetical protein
MDINNSERLITPCGNHKFWNIFAPDCKLGVYNFDKYNKDYVYVLMPKSKAKIFLRCVVFLTVKGKDKPYQFAIVHRWRAKIGGPLDKHNWEPIKGQVEEKELKAARRITGTKDYNSLLLEVLRYTIQREIVEESKINPALVKNLQFRPELAYTSNHADYPEQNMYYQYLYFTAEINEKDFIEAQDKLDKASKDPRTLLLRKDEREKNALALWSSRKGFESLMGGTPSAIVRLYLNNF